MSHSQGSLPLSVSGRGFQLLLAEIGVSICTRNRIMTGLRFLLRVTLRRLDLSEEVYHIREPEKLPLVMSVDEIRRLLAVGSSLKRRVLLSLGYGCGLRASEIVRLKVKHIDKAQKIIRIEQSKGRKDRNVMLPQEMLGLLRQWWRVRPSRHDGGIPVQERWLFPSRKSACRPITTRHLNRLFHEAADAAGIKKGVTLPVLDPSWANVSGRDGECALLKCGASAAPRLMTIPLKWKGDLNCSSTYPSPFDVSEPHSRESPWVLPAFKALNEVQRPPMRDDWGGYICFQTSPSCSS